MSLRGQPRARCAQSADWNNVESLAPDTRVIVRSDTARHRVHCNVVAVDERMLVCEHEFRMIGQAERFTFDRAHVREVRREHHDANRLLTSAIVIGGLTAVGSVPGLVVGLAVSGGLAMGDAALPLVPGTVVYRNTAPHAHAALAPDPTPNPASDSASAPTISASAGPMPRELAPPPL